MPDKSASFIHLLYSSLLKAQREPMIRTKEPSVFKGAPSFRIFIIRVDNSKIILWKGFLEIKSPLPWQFIQLFEDKPQHSSRQLLILYLLHLPSIKPATKTTTAEIFYLPQDSLNHFPPLRHTPLVQYGPRSRETTTIE